MIGPCRRRRGRRSTSPGSAPPAGASGTAPSLVFVEAQMDAQLGLAASGRRNPDRPARCNTGLPPRISSSRPCPPSRSVDQIVQRSELVDRIRFHRVGVDHRLADIAQRVRSWRAPARERRRLAIAGDDQARALDALAGRAPAAAIQSRMLRFIGAVGGRLRHAELRAASAGRNPRSRCPQRQAVIRLGARGRRHRLDDVQPVHLRLVVHAPAAAPRTARA